MPNPWLTLIKKKVAEIKKEGKFKGREIVKEAIKRAQKEYKKTK